METTRSAEKWQRQPLVHRQLKLKVEGSYVSHGQWQVLMKIALKYPEKDWEIVETFNMGEKIVTKHKSLLSINPSFLVKENNKGVR